MCSCWCLCYPVRSLFEQRSRMGSHLAQRLVLVELTNKFTAHRLILYTYLDRLSTRTQPPLNLFIPYSKMPAQPLIGTPYIFIAG